MLPAPSFAFLHSWHLLLPCTFGLLTYSDHYLFHRYVAASNLHHLFIEIVYGYFIYLTYVHYDFINKLIMSSTTRYVFVSGVTVRSSSHFIASSKGLLDLYRAWMFKGMLAVLYRYTSSVLPIAPLHLQTYFHCPSKVIAFSSIWKINITHWIDISFLQV